MKRLLFISYNMKIGGVQKSLLNLLNNISNDYHIDLYLFDINGELLKDLKPSINVLKPFKNLTYCGISQKEALKNGFFYYLKRGVFALKCRFFGSKKVIEKKLKKNKIHNTYDAVISYFQNVSPKNVMYGCNALALTVKATKKISFVHGDFEFAHLNTQSNIEEYENFDVVAGVSTTGVSQIKKYLIKPTIILVRNTHDINKIIELSKKPPDLYLDSNICNLVTVSRLSDEKGMDRIINICRKLEDERLKYNWIVVGTSNDFRYYKNLCNSKNIKNLHFVGEKINPYPYIKWADYLVVSSYHEAAPMVIDEANIIGTELITTNFRAALELCKNNIVCDNNEESLYDSIRRAVVSYTKKNLKIPKYSHKDNEDRIKSFKNSF